MPELPDVEAFRRYFAAHAAGERVERVEAPAPEIIRNTTVQALGRALAGRRFEEPRRHGKWLLAGAEEPTVLLHFGMTGSLAWADHGSPRTPHDRVVFHCEDGELRLHMPRKLGGVWLARTPSEIAEITGPLGPDAAALSREELARLLRARRGGLKSALMDQELIAGIGNLVADEVLWRACLHPGGVAADLDGAEVDALHGALRGVIEDSVDQGRVPRDGSWLTGVRDHDEPACPRCGTPLTRATIAGRSTLLCSECQRRTST